MQDPAGRRRATAPFAGVDLRRPKGYPASAAPAEVEAEAEAEAREEEAGDPCPRCESRDTKFCYYNNYNTSQPRHYCKSCRRYWTKGGTLRNVPVGGGSHKSSSSSSPSRKSPKRAKNSKRRRVAPAAPEPEPVAGTDDSVAAAAPEATSTAEDTADGPAAAPSAAEAGSTDPSVTLGLGLTDAGGKEPSDQSPFEWPSGCDLGSYWAPAVFADTDPALFLDLP